MTTLRLAAVLVLTCVITPAPAQTANRVAFHSQLNTRSDYAGIWGYTDGGREYAIMGDAAGTTFVDVTDPNHPVQVALQPGHFTTNAYRDVKTLGHYAYIVAYDDAYSAGVQIVDLSALPASVSLVYDSNQDFNVASTVTYDEKGYLYPAAAAGVVIMSLANPIHPVKIGNIVSVAHSTGYAYASQVRNDLAFVAYSYVASIETYDLSDRTRPAVVATFPTPRGFPFNEWLTDDGRYLFVTDFLINRGGYLSIYDVSNPAAPVQVSTFQGPNLYHPFHTTARDVRVKGSLAYCTWTTDGLRIVDISDPALPVEVGYYDTEPSTVLSEEPVGGRGVYPLLPSGNILVSDYERGLFVLSFSAQYGILTGTVRDATTGLPISGASVRRMGDDAPARTGSDGRYAVDADPGPVTLGAIAPGYHGALVSAVATVGPRQSVDIVLQRLPTGSLSGVVGGDGSLAGAQLFLTGTGFLATTGPGGSYSFPAVPRGLYTLVASSPGFAPASATVTVQGGTTVSVDLTLAPAFLYLDMESDPGWSLDPYGTDDAIRGAWVRADPTGSSLPYYGALKPEDDHTPAPGKMALVTGPGEAGGDPFFAGLFHGTTTLQTPYYDVSTLAHPVVSFSSWFKWTFLSNAVFEVEGSTDAGQTWFDLSTREAGLERDVPLTPARWAEVHRSVETLPTPPASLSVRFAARDFNGSAEAVTEAGIDDFRIVDSCDARALPGTPDGDGDGIIDECDPCPNDALNDSDADWICADADNAPFARNPQQQDADLDGVGDAGDNCPTVYNPDQADNDVDALGDACDPDDDNDGVPDLADGDRDGDGIADAADDCPGSFNPGQHDLDGDGLGDVCDRDDGLVTGLAVLDAPGSNQADSQGIDLRWTAETGNVVYNVYRGLFEGGGSLAEAECLTKVSGAHAVDKASPPPGRAFFYVVTPVVSTPDSRAGFPREEGAEGSPGYSPSGTPHVLINRCPRPAPIYPTAAGSSN
ncbi:MAG: choice-of-anchor B family protein [Acidobacteria bacterium]|nr:choice-of-anchor B family protein [Acidobacteriota bacterium]